MKDQYHEHPYVSNSKLTELQRGIIAKDQLNNFEEAFRMGTLVDAYTTEPHKVDRFQNTVIGTNYIYTEEELRTGRRMRDAVMADSFAGPFIKQCKFQTEYFSPNEEFYWNGVTFYLDIRCRYDLDAWDAFMGGDIKSTNAKTPAQFLQACRNFGYFRSRYFYMRNSGYKSDVIIGVSKVFPHPVFKVFLSSVPSKEPPYQLYLEGKHECHKLAYEYWALVS